MVTGGPKLRMLAMQQFRQGSAGRRIWPSPDGEGEKNEVEVTRCRLAKGGEGGAGPRETTENDPRLQGSFDGR